jgi:hypothetical protein
VKKFWAVFIIILVASAAVFFAGWAQFYVPVGAVAVVRSKTHGVAPGVIESGKLNWIWYKLIPGNAKLISFVLRPKSADVRKSGVLQQGELYNALTGIAADYGWELAISVDYKLNEEALPGIVDANEIEGVAGLDSYMAKLSSDLSEYLSNSAGALFDSAARSFAQKSEIDETESILNLTTNIQNNLARELAAKFSMIKLINCDIAIRKYPDFAQYAKAKELYEIYLSEQKKLLQNDVLDSAHNHIVTETRIRELTRYGELFTKYPMLLEYLKLPKQERAND